MLLSIQISKELYDICFVRESVYITHIFNLYFYDTRETKIWNKSFWQVFNHDWILLLLKLVFFSKKVFTSALNAKKWYGIQGPTRDWHIPYSAQKSMRLSLLYKNSQILQQKTLYFGWIMWKCNDAKICYSVDPGIPMLLTGIKYVGKTWFIYLHKNMFHFGEIFMSLRSSCCCFLLCFKGMLFWKISWHENKWNQILRFSAGDVL